MGRSVVVNPGEPHSPRVFTEFVKPNAPANQVYLKVQPDGGVIFYMAASLDRPLQKVFDHYAYNDFMTESHFIKMCVENKLFPANKNPDPLKYIFNSVAKEEPYIEYDQFLQVLHLLSRQKFRKMNLPEQDAVNAIVAHLLQTSPRDIGRHKLMNCGVQTSIESADKACSTAVETTTATVDCEPRMQDQEMQSLSPEVKSVGINVNIVPEKTKEEKEKEEREKAEKEAQARKPVKQFKDSEVQTVKIKNEVNEYVDTRQQPDILTALRGEQDSLLYRAFCLYSKFVPEACENLLSEVDCALMFKDGDLMAVPTQSSELRGLPPKMARQYFEKIVSRQKHKEAEKLPPPKEAGEADSQKSEQSTADQKDSEPSINYREFKALVFMASQWICETENSYWSFVRIVRDRFLPGLFRGDPWQQQNLRVLREMSSVRKRGPRDSSEESSTESTDETSTSSSSSSSRSGTEESISSTTTSCSSVPRSEGRRSHTWQTPSRPPVHKGREKPTRKEPFGAYEDEQPIGVGNVFYEALTSSEDCFSDGSTVILPERFQPYSLGASNGAMADFSRSGGGPWGRGPPPQTLRKAMKDFKASNGGRSRRGSNVSAVSFDIPMPSSPDSNSACLRY